MSHPSGHHCGRAPSASFRTYELAEVLFGEQRLVVNLDERILTLVGGHGEFWAQASCCASEFSVIGALLDAHPAVCPLAVLYAAFAGLSREDAREILEALEEANVLTPLLDRLNEMLTVCRATLLAFHIGIQPVPPEEGYRLIRLVLL